MGPNQSASPANHSDYLPKEWSCTSTGPFRVLVWSFQSGAEKKLWRGEAGTTDDNAPSLMEKRLWENETSIHWEAEMSTREKVLMKFKFLLPINPQGQVYLSPVYCLVMWANYFLFLEFALILVTKTINKGKLKLLPYFNCGNEKWISYIQECKLVQLLWRNNLLLSTKVKDIHTYDLRIPHLDIHFWEMCAQERQETWLRMFTASLALKLETTQEPSACMNIRMDTLWYILIQLNIHWEQIDLSI